MFLLKGRHPGSGSPTIVMEREWMFFWWTFLKGFIFNQHDLPGIHCVHFSMYHSGGAQWIFVVDVLIQIGTQISWQKTIMPLKSEGHYLWWKKQLQKDFCHITTNLSDVIKQTFITNHVIKACHQSKMIYVFEKKTIFGISPTSTKISWEKMGSLGFCDFWVHPFVLLRGISVVRH